MAVSWIVVGLFGLAASSQLHEEIDTLGLSRVDEIMFDVFETQQRRRHGDSVQFAGVRPFFSPHLCACVTVDYVQMIDMSEARCAYASQSNGNGVCRTLNLRVFIASPFTHFASPEIISHTAVQIQAAQHVEPHPIRAVPPPRS